MLDSKYLKAAQHVLDYATSKQLRGGWGAISECYSLEEMAEFLADRSADTKTAAMTVARAHIKVWNELNRSARDDLDYETRYAR